MKRFKYKFFGECLVFSLVFAILLTFFVACSKDVAGGSSEDAGILAITGKDIAGVSQKGPFVKGSSVVLRETSAKGDFKPTGREFFATTRSDKGDFKIDSLALESQFVLLTATGYYKSEMTGKNSDCQISLNAVSDVSGRDEVNINVLTHLEYDRTLRLIKGGKSFSEAKRLARKELLEEFGYEDIAEDLENLDITNNGDGDLALKEISAHVDTLINSCDQSGTGRKKHCTLSQEFIDFVAEEFGSSGKLPEVMTGETYGMNFWCIENYKED